MSVAPAFTPVDEQVPTIARPRLVRSLVKARGKQVVLVGAPAGYGKTTLLREWLASDQERRPSAWVSLNPTDADPARLLARLRAAVERAVPGFGRSAPPRLLSEPGWEAAAVARLLDELAALREPVVLALDDYHLLGGQRAHNLMDLVAAGLPATVQLAVATRAEPRLPVARLRANGALLELDAAALRFDEAESRAVLAASGRAAARGVLAALVERTEGWPAGLHLAIEAMPDAALISGPVVSGTHRHLVDYLSDEVLHHQSASGRAFLLRTSILARMCGRLCEAVLPGSDAQARLESLDRSNTFVVPLDEERGWYRYHRLFGEMLRAELCKSQPALAAELHRRASAWFDAEGDHETAAEHALAAVRVVASAPARPAVDDLDDLDNPDEPVVAPRPWAQDLPCHRSARLLDFGQHLTDRELTVLRLFPSPLSQREIARELFVSLNTVKTHSRAIYRKLGVSSRPAANRRARELGLLRSPGDREIVLLG